MLQHHTQQSIMDLSLPHMFHLLPILLVLEYSILLLLLIPLYLKNLLMGRYLLVKQLCTNCKTHSFNSNLLNSLYPSMCCPQIVEVTIYWVRKAQLWENLREGLVKARLTQRGHRASKYGAADISPASTTFSHPYHCVIFIYYVIMVLNIITRVFKILVAVFFASSLSGICYVKYLLILYELQIPPAMKVVGFTPFWEYGKLNNALPKSIYLAFFIFFIFYLILFCFLLIPTEFKNLTTCAPGAHPWTVLPPFTPKIKLLSKAYPFLNFFLLLSRFTFNNLHSSRRHVNRVGDIKKYFAFQIFLNWVQ